VTTAKTARLEQKFIVPPTEKARLNGISTSIMLRSDET
jgi:hypothetical protein